MMSKIQDPKTRQWYINEITRLKKENNAVILAHNYQIPVIQDLADYVGDSLGLSKQAAQTDADLIVFCGVHFMAETAAILCPEKKVIIPDLEAGCSLAETITGADLRKWRKKNPDSVIVCYVNTSADVKAESDYCCTSANAVKIVESIPKDKEILFVPDMFLGSYVSSITKRKLQLWPGECHVHAGIKPQDIIKHLENNPDVEFIIHPECGCVSQCMYYIAEGDIPKDRVKFLSTGGMVNYVKKSNSKKFLVATETGILYRLKKENPEKEFLAVKEDAVCEYMKMITLEKLYISLNEMKYEVKVPKNIAIKAKKSIDRMLEIK